MAELPLPELPLPESPPAESPPSVGPGSQSMSGGTPSATKNIILWHGGDLPANYQPGAVQPNREGEDRFPPHDGVELGKEDGLPIIEGNPMIYTQPIKTLMVNHKAWVAIQHECVNQYTLAEDREADAIMLSKKIVRGPNQVEWSAQEQLDQDEWDKCGGHRRWNRPKRPDALEINSGPAFNTPEQLHNGWISIKTPMAFLEKLAETIKDPVDMASLCGIYECNEGYISVSVDDGRLKIKENKALIKPPIKLEEGQEGQEGQEGELAQGGGSRKRSSRKRSSGKRSSGKRSSGKRRSGKRSHGKRSHGKRRSGKRSHGKRSHGKRSHGKRSHGKRRSEKR